MRVPLAGVIDMAAETARIDKELAKVDADLDGIEKKLSNPNFVERAPAEVVEKDRARADELRTTKQKLINHRAVMQGSDQPPEEKTMETNNPNPNPSTPPAAARRREGGARRRRGGRGRQGGGPGRPDAGRGAGEEGRADHREGEEAP